LASLIGYGGWLEGLNAHGLLLRYGSPRQAFDCHILVGREVFYVLQDELPPTTLRESVLEMGAEGGSVAILRERKARDVWQFQMKTDESTLYDFLSKEDQGINLFSQTEYVQSFHEALGLLNDRYLG
jgi:hypothetical protein